METIVISSDSSSDEEVLPVSRNDESKKPPNKKITCPSCKRMLPKTSGIISKKCQHFVCKECIIDYYFKNQNFGMMCQFKAAGGTDSCGINFSETEFRSVLSDIEINQLDETIASWSTVCVKVCCIIVSFSFADSKFTARGDRII